MKAASPADLAEIDNFCDALWLEDGWPRQRSTAIAPTSAGSRCGWPTTPTKPLLDLRETTLTAFIAHLSRQTRATSQARYLSTLRRFYRWQLGRGRIVVDPTLKLANPAQPSRLPKVMSEKQVEALLAAPDLDTPLGLRDRAMLETLYATGLRVSELVGLKLFEVSFNDGVLRALGKGSKERLVPLGELAIDWLSRYLNEARPKSSRASRATPCSSPPAAAR
jgi:integrase/recombinase XerD